MKIGFLQTSFTASSIGGGEHHTEQLAYQLQQFGHDVTIHTNVPAERREVPTQLDVIEHPTPLGINPVNELVLARRAAPALSSYDVVTLTDESGWLGVTLPVPTVMIFHLVWAGWIDRQESMMRVLSNKPEAFVYSRMQRRICERASAIVSISENVREDINKIGSYDEKIHDIPNGVDIDRFTPSEKADTFTVHFQGRLVEMKQPDKVIEAVARSNGDWKLTIGGDGPLRRDLETKATKLGIDDRVEFLGYVPDSELPERYARSHICVLPSKYEGMPLTILEAAASGTAIVASPRAATDFVTEEIGRVVEPVPDRLAQELDALAKSPDQVRSMGRAARERAKMYSWSKIAKQYVSLYSEVVSE